MRQTMEMMRNPHAMQQAMRSQELMISQLENHPEGFNALRRMQEDIADPMMQAASENTATPMQANPWAAPAPAAGTGTGTGVAPPPGTALPNPWGGNQPAAGAGVGAGAGAGAGGFPPMGGMGGMPNMDSNQMASMMNNPLVQQQMQALMSDPAAMQQMAAMNPQLAPMLQNPQVRSMLSNPEAMRQMMNPANMQVL